MMDHQTKGNRCAVLIVDDEPLLRMVLVDAFSDAGFLVSEAQDATDALALLEREPDIGIVITDIQMPGSMDGLRRARYIHDAYPPIALIVASGAVRPDRTDLPADAIFMPKPIDTRGLLEHVANLVAAQD